VRLLFLFLFLAFCSRDAKIPFVKTDSVEQFNIIIENEFNVTYTLLTVNENCQISLQIKNISIEDKRNSFTMEAYSYGEKKFESFVVERRSKPGEVINSVSKFNKVECANIKKIIFYK
jgi:hypothetical protein